MFLTKILALLKINTSIPEKPAPVPEEISKDLNGCKIVLNNTVYFIVSGNNGLAEYNSLYNPETKKFLRQYSSKIIESAPDYNESSFVIQSSFILEAEDDKLGLKFVNEGKGQAYLCKQGTGYRIMPAVEVQGGSKALFQIISTKDRPAQALKLELEIIRLKLEANQKKLVQYQEYFQTNCFALIRSHNRSVFSNGASVWNFIEHTRNIKARFSSYEQLELFFYRRFFWANKLSELTDNTEVYLKYGAYSSYLYIPLMYKCIEANIPVLSAEDGYIHSIISPAFYKNRREFRLGYSITLDAIAPLFDATLSNCFEAELNSEYNFTKLQLDRAKTLISEIVKNKITKYNGQPMNPDLELEPDNFKSCVLVVDQVCNDWSIRKGYADEQTFITMLDTAINENPESLILVKVHPVMLANPYMNTNENHKYGHYTDYILKPEVQYRVKFIACSANPYTILDLVQKVYVCSSQFGFEALMAGKEVHIWGSPFYAGWGIGVQRVRSPAIERRRRSRSLEEIFYCAYITYSRYLNPFTYERCELEEFLNVLPDLRCRYFKYQELVQSRFTAFTEPHIKGIIPVVFALDEVHGLQSILALSSLLHNDPVNQYYIYCLSWKILSAGIQKIITKIATDCANLAGIKFLCPGIRNGPLLNSRLPALQLLKFTLPQISGLPSRVVYSDSNVIFLRGISNAWQISSDFHALICAGPDLDENLARIQNNLKVRCRFWDQFLPALNCAGRYINGSFLILNLENLRNAGSQTIWEHYLQNSGELNSTDILFLGCSPKIYYLSPRYAVPAEFFTDESKYLPLFNSYLPPEDLLLVKEKTVAVQYPADTLPWQSQSEHLKNWWSSIIKIYPELNEILHNCGSLNASGIPDSQPDQV